MLYKMIFDVKFDREIEEKHYISPGGYAICTPEGQSISFDFTTFEGKVNKNDKTVLYAEVHGLDVDCYPESVNITGDMMRKSSFEEFFIFTGEYDDPEINPVKICSLAFEFIDDDGNVTHYWPGTEKINQINKVLSN